MRPPPEGQQPATHWPFGRKRWQAGLEGLKHLHVLPDEAARQQEQGPASRGGGTMAHAEVRLSPEASAAGCWSAGGQQRGSSQRQSVRSLDAQVGLRSHRGLVPVLYADDERPSPARHCSRRWNAMQTALCAT